MKYKIIVFGILSSFLLTSIDAIAQDSIFYSNIRGERFYSPDIAPKISIIKKVDSIWRKVDYYTYSRKIAEIGHYKDTGFKFNHGEFKSFHGNELLESSGYYENDKKHGFFENYYPNGMMRDSSYYINGMPSGNCKAWYSDGSLEKLLQLDSLGNGAGVAIGFFPNGNISYKGRLANGMRKIGPWTYYHENGNKASILYYPVLDESILEMTPELKYDSVEKTRYDSLTSYYKASCFDLNGIEQSACEIKNSKPIYIKGEKGWNNFLTKRLDGFGNLISSHTNTIVYIADFIVDTEGKLTSILLSNKINIRLDNLVRQVFSTSTGWATAIHNNRKIPFMHRQAIVLSPPIN